MKTKIYTILYNNGKEWCDLEREYTEEEVEKELRRLRKDYGLKFRKKFLRECEMRTLTAREPGTYIPVQILEKENWAGDKYLLFKTENGNVAEVDFCHDAYRKRDFFRIFGYRTDIWDTRLSRQAAIRCAKKQVEGFFNSIGDKRPIVYC